MRVLACDLLDVQRASRISHKSQPKFLDKLGIKLADLLRRNIQGIADIENELVDTEEGRRKEWDE